MKPDQLGIERLQFGGVKVRAERIARKPCAHAGTTRSQLVRLH